MPRLKNRKYGRTTETVTGGSSTHIVKIGFDARGPGDTFPRPGKYNGFVICRDRVGPDNNLIVDHGIMKRLDQKWNEAKLKQAQGDQLKAPDDLLPKTLHFVLIGDAVKDSDEQWNYPRTFSESLEWWGKIGLMCIGNGDTALRTNEKDRTKRKIECVPVGREDFSVEKFCPHSMPRIAKDRKGNDQRIIDCKSHSRLMLCLYIEGPDGKPEPLCRELGWNGRFRFDTSSGYNPLRILAELDAAADRCEGRIHLLRGTLSFGMQRKRYEGGVSVVGQVMFSLSEEDIANRERELHRQKMEREGRVLEGAPRPATLIGMDDVPEPTIDPEEDLRVAAVAAEASDPPWPDSQEGEPTDEFDNDNPAGDYAREAQAGLADDYGKEPEAEPYRDPEPGLIIESAPPKLLADSLDAFIRQAAREEGNPVKEVWRRMGVIELPDGRRGAPQSPHSFLAHSPEWPSERRIDDLRALCREFADNDPRFQLIESFEIAAAG